MFLPHTCTVYNKTFSEVDGATKEALSSLWVFPCMARASTKEGVIDSWLWREQDGTSYEVIIQSESVTIGDIVDLNLSWVSIGKYVIYAIDKNYSLISWWIDNVYFKCKKWN